MRRTSRSAAKITRASLRNSDGCIEKLPTAIHARASLTVTPSPGVNGASMPRPAMTSSGTDSRRSHVRLTRSAMTRPTVPRPAHISWRLKMLYGLRPFAASVCADADSTITRPSITNSVMMTART